MLWRAALLLGGVTLPLGWLLTAPAQGAQPAAASRTVTVPDTAEAWYAASPIDLCTTPLGCPPAEVPSSPYPDQTLHVGLAATQETARTYLLPGIAGLPYGADVSAATMTLPVATGSSDGSQAVDTAEIVACLATAPFEDGTQGSPSAPPKVDCKVKAIATYDAKKSAFSLDVTTFVQKWSAGTLAAGIALVPDVANAAPSDAWHVAFNGRKRAGGSHISTTITFTPPAPLPTGDVADPTPDNPPPAPQTPAIVPPAPSVPDLPATGTPPDTGAPPVVAPQQPVTPAVQPVALSRGFQYPMAFLMPLALLAGAVFFGRLFTRDATPLKST
jgi:hypothetical protein